jgi:hypothetical protein
LQEDPIVGDTYEPLSFNRYLYCEASPADNVDPTGLIAVPSFGCPLTEELFRDARRLNDAAWTIDVGWGSSILGGFIGPVLGAIGGIMSDASFEAKAKVAFAIWCAREKHQKRAQWIRDHAWDPAL